MDEEWFVKPRTKAENNPAIELKDTLRLITDYWKICREPAQQNIIAKA